MTKSTALLFGLVLTVGVLLFTSSFLTTYGKSKEQKAIDKALGNIGFKNICKLDVHKVSSGNTITINIKECNPVTPPPVVTCPPDQHLVNGVCVPNVIPPPPPPPPVGDNSKVCLVGDLSGSSVPSKMVNCNLKIGLGDLGYASDLKYFKGLNFNRCVVGNHDAPEDGSSSIYQEALAYCGDHWSQVVGKSTLIIGLNTNGDVNTQVNFVKSLPLANYHTVIILSHKGGHVPPSSHHPAEAATLYKQLEALIPSTVKLWEVVGHNHVMAAAPSMGWYQSGGGGKSHYTCGTDNVWTFCDNSNYGYLELTIDNTNGNTVAKFIK